MGGYIARRFLTNIYLLGGGGGRKPALNNCYLMNSFLSFDFLSFTLLFDFELKTQTREIRVQHAVANN